MGLNYFTYGGISSSQYDIYISGEALFDAPKRNTEEVTIPGRNGNFLLDKGSYENIKMTYPAFCYSKTYAEFIDNITRFRNAVATKTGYQRLTDTFNYSEYRMAAFLDGIEVDPILYNSGAKFEVVFDCMPQRFLMSGESAIDITSGSTMLNPTPFDAKPLIEAEGYGELSFNGYTINVENAIMGNVILGENVRNKVEFSAGIADAGDTITVDASTNALLTPIGISALTSESVTSQPSKGTASIAPLSPNSVLLVSRIDNIVDTFTYGTGATNTYTATYSISYAKGGLAKTCTITMVAKLVYSATHNTISFSVSVTSSVSADWTRDGSVCTINEASVYSTLSMLGNPTYIDCDLGECYRIESGDIVSLDKYIDLGSDLPTLAPGSNEITFDNTFTDIKIKPRWWIV